MSGKLSAAEYLQATKANYIRPNKSGFSKVNSSGSFSVDKTRPEPPALRPKLIKTNGKAPPVPPKKVGNLVKNYINLFDQQNQSEKSSPAVPNGSNDNHHKPLKIWTVPPVFAMKPNKPQLYQNFPSQNDSKEPSNETFKAVPVVISNNRNDEKMGSCSRSSSVEKPESHRKPPAVPPKPTQMDLKARLFRLFISGENNRPLSPSTPKSSATGLNNSSLSPGSDSVSGRKDFHKSTPNLLETGKKTVATNEAESNPKFVSFDDTIDSGKVQLRMERQKSMPNLNDTNNLGDERKSYEGASTVAAHLGSTYEADSQDESASHSHFEAKKDDSNGVNLPRYRPYLPVINRHSSQNSPSAMQLLFPPNGKEEQKAVVETEAFQFEVERRLELSPELNEFFDSMGIDRSFLDLLERKVTDCGESVRFFSSVASSILSSGTPTRSKSSTSESLSEACGSAAKRMAHRGNANPQLNGFLQTQNSRNVSIVERNARVIKWIYACAK